MKRSGPTGVVSQQSDGGNGDGVLLLARDKGRGERIWEDSVRKGEDMYRGARGLWLKIMLGIGCDGGRGSAMATTKESSLNHTKKTTFVIYCCLLHKKNCFTMPTFKDFKHFVYTSHLSYTHKNMWKRKLSLDSVKNYYTLAAFIGGISIILLNHGVFLFFTPLPKTVKTVYFWQLYKHTWTPSINYN